MKCKIEVIYSSYKYLLIHVLAEQRNYYVFLSFSNTAPSIGGLSGLGGSRPISTARHTLPRQ